MPITNYGDGLASFGAPVVPVGQAPVRGWAGGNVWWVGNAVTTGAQTGEKSDPFQTMSQALKALLGKTNSGDVIYVLPGHAENVSAADWASDTGAASGFSIVGLGTGPMRPAFTWTIATSTWLVDTANVEFANLRLFLAGAHGAGSALTVAAPITISAAGCRIVNCDIRYGFDADQLVTAGITTTVAGDNFEFLGNYCLAETASANTTFIRLVGSDNSIIAGNYIRGATSVATVGPVQCLTTLSLNLRVTDNFIANMKSDSTIAFTPMTGTTGIVGRNIFYLDGSGILPVTAALMEWFENYVINDQGEAGALVGTPSA